MNTMELLNRCTANCEYGYDREVANSATTNIIANAMKYVYGRLNDAKFSKKEKLVSIVKYLDSLNPEVYISMADYNIMHSRLCAVIRYLVNEKFADTSNQQMMIYLNVAASMRERIIKRDAREQGYVQVNLINATVKCVNYLNMAFGMMLDSLGMYEDIVF
jgi:hypothetical protein